MKSGIGIMLCGLNGCGKSTLGKALAERTGFHFIDNENLFFRDNKKDKPYANPKSRIQVTEMLMDEVKEHGNFIFAAVKGDYGEEILPLYSHIVKIEVPREIRLKRVRERSYKKFGRRMLPGGDLYEQEKVFFEAVEKREESLVDNWITTLNCPVITVDGTRRIEKNVDEIVRLLCL